MIALIFWAGVLVVGYAIYEYARGWADGQELDSRRSRGGGSTAGDLSDDAGTGREAWGDNSEAEWSEAALSRKGIG